ncbi:hypothetical protein [Mucilaginibacter psychrotolerans]|uniref:DUF2185 domain-containing protein n=1 Tax=Mucilaginibacter psychrotolerans TaxID=1524096 RepID=A0A4Y8SHU9_9SPHI|nr:hypothetical protein [Mucilaginibacter psychrotolerans]TFF38452.1 hypothetical protein E2R66_08260 [Mucilaginibacter psychrotolerans]
MKKNILSYIAQVIGRSSESSTVKTAYKKFKEPENTAVFTTKFITADKHAITLVKHNSDDNTWEFFSDDKFDDYEAVAKVVSLKEIIALDSSVLEIADLAAGYCAHRKLRNESWEIALIK